MDKDTIINNKLNELSKSSFRSSFNLSKKDILYIKKRGINIIKKHAYDIINKRLSGYPINNDGRQTPMRGHPVFIAQHATGCCCRGCLYKWHGIIPDRNLTKNEVNYIVSIIITWIINNIKKADNDE